MNCLLYKFWIYLGEVYVGMCVLCVLCMDIYADVKCVQWLFKDKRNNLYVLFGFVCIPNPPNLASTLYPKTKWMKRIFIFIIIV